MRWNSPTECWNNVPFCGCEKKFDIVSRLGDKFEPIFSKSDTPFHLRQLDTPSLVLSLLGNLSPRVRRLRVPESWPSYISFLPPPFYYCCVWLWKNFRFDRKPGYSCQPFKYSSGEGHKRERDSLGSGYLVLDLSHRSHTGEHEALVSDLW